MFTIEGAPRERGQAHGEHFRALIADHLDLWLQSIADDLGRDPVAYIHDFLADTDFMPAIERWTPALLEEVRGIAEGSGADFQVTLARQLSDEEPWYRREQKFGHTGDKGCSSIGVDAHGDQPVIIAQNMDTPVWWNGHQILLRVKYPTGVEALVFSVAGKLSLCGMNNRGLGICCDTLSQLDYSRRGLPEDFIVRGYLEQASPAEGLGFLNDVPHASGQNYTIPSAGGRALNLECSAQGVVSWRPWLDADRVFHTNHPMGGDHQDLFRRHTLGLSGAEIDARFNGSSRPRFDELQRRLSDKTARLTPEVLKTALSARSGPISRTGEYEGQRDGYTLGSLIMTLGADPYLEVAPGPPHQTPYQRFGF